MARLVVMMMLDLICWSAVTFFAYKANYVTIAACIGAVGVLVIMRELKVLWFVHRCNQIAKQNGDWE